jgi:shikimate kinase
MARLEVGVNLYGMMNCGKTTVGGIIAREQNMTLLDTDVLFYEQVGVKPGDFIKANGPDHFMITQRAVIMDQPRGEAEVWGTGGAVAKDEVLVEHLGGFGVGAFLFVSPDILEARTPEEDIAKLANPNNLSYRDLYLVERMPFYRAAADVIIQVSDVHETELTTAERVVGAVMGHGLVLGSDNE